MRGEGGREERTQVGKEEVGERREGGEGKGGGGGGGSVNLQKYGVS